MVLLLLVLSATVVLILRLTRTIVLLILVILVTLATLLLICYGIDVNTLLANAKAFLAFASLTALTILTVALSTALLVRLLLRTCVLVQAAQVNLTL